MPLPELVLHHPRPSCKLSIILLDWGVRESFHSLDYLNRQTVARDQYELIWLEFYRRKPLKLQEMVFRRGKQRQLFPCRNLLLVAEPELCWSKYVGAKDSATQFDCESGFPRARGYRCGCPWQWF